MTEHDARILAPKNKPADDREALAEFARTHVWCQACGRIPMTDNGLTIHHIIGGRGGRADEPCNLMYLCWEPCHMLAEGLNVRQPWRHIGVETFAVGDEGRFSKCLAPLLPKITLGIALSMKFRAGELIPGFTERHPKEPIVSTEWDRLTVLHGRNLPDLEPIPAFFVDLYRRNRPELVPRTAERG